MHKDLREKTEEQYDLLLAKLEIQDPKGLGEETEDNFIIFECFFNGKYIKYYPEMIINICTNFLFADE